MKDDSAFSGRGRFLKTWVSKDRGQVQVQVQGQGQEDEVEKEKQSLVGSQTARALCINGVWR